MALNFQAFVDDSHSPQGEFVLAGHIATAEKWELFCNEWEALLPRFGILADNGKYHFKMSEMALSSERLERVPTFYRVIEDYVAFSISCRINLLDFGHALARAKVETSKLNWVINYDRWENPFYFTFRGLIDNIHLQKEFLEPVIPLDQTIDFIFDNQA